MPRSGPSSRGASSAAGSGGENPAANIKGIGKRRPRGKSLGKAGNELRVREARAWYETALDLADGGDEGASAALVALLLGMRASEITSRRVSDLDQDRAPGDLLWIPCSKTPAGRRTLEVPEVLRPMLVACCEGKAPTSFIFETEAGGAHWRDWILHSSAVSVASNPRIAARPRRRDHVIRPRGRARDDDRLCSARCRRCRHKPARSRAS